MLKSETLSWVYAKSLTMPTLIENYKQHFNNLGSNCLPKLFEAEAYKEKRGMERMKIQF